MFENLSDREKKLMMAIGALVPIAIVFFCIYSLTSSFAENKKRLQALDLQILDQEALELEGTLADRRKSYYANASLHPSIHIAKNDYQNWLSTEGLPGANVDHNSGSRLRSDGKTIGESVLFKVSAEATLPEFNDFLSRFYQLDMLHRITAMTLTPQNVPRKAKPVRNGVLTVKLTVEVLSLKDGKNRDGFEDFGKHLANSEKDYKTILHRNIFGPANSEPVLNIPNKTTPEGKPFSFKFTATDANKNDLLTIELMDNTVKTATVKQAKETDRRAEFEMTAQPPGKYKFKVKVSDNGFPVKSSIKEFFVTVKKKPDPKPQVAKKKEEPEIDYIRMVKVTGITSDGNSDKLQVWVLILHTGETLRLTAGETFVVDEKKYSVESVDRNEATFTRKGKTYLARPGHNSQGALVETNL